MHAVYEVSQVTSIIDLRHVTTLEHIISTTRAAVIS